MSARVVSDVDERGRLVARKRSRDSIDAARLRHEAEVLAEARHPGVVELTACDDDDDDGGVTLATIFVGTHSLDTVGPLSLERAAGLVAAVAEIVADLHDMGVVHGRIDASHVLIGPGGRPLLCGFAGGGRIGTTPPPPGSTAHPGLCDPAATSEATLAPDVDVFGLGALLRSLLDETTEVEPIPDRRLSVSRLRPRWSGYQRRALLTLADHATDDAPLRRPPARRLAADILTTVPSATIDTGAFALLRSSDDDSHSRSRRDPRRLLSLGAVAVGIILIVFSLTASGGSGSVPRTTSTSTSTSTTTPTSAAQRGGVIEVGTRHYTVGEPTDQVVTGDWDCDGEATVALLRPNTGAVYVFDRWAAFADDVSVVPTTVVADARSLGARDGNGCSTLIVVRSDGSIQEIVA